MNKRRKWKAVVSIYTTSATGLPTHYRCRRAQRTLEGGMAFETVNGLTGVAAPGMFDVWERAKGVADPRPPKAPARFMGLGR